MARGVNGAQKYGKINRPLLTAIEIDDGAAL
jgi:hypothetical protein